MSEHSAHQPEELLAQSVWLRRLARSLVRDADAAEDLVQDAWVAALQNAPRERGTLGPWLGGVVRNLARKHRRGEGHRRAREEAGARHESDDDQPGLEERVALQRELLELVLGLEQPYRATLLERYFEERSPAEIARRSGVPVRTVKTRLARGLALLRERLAHRHPEGLPALVVGLWELGRGPAPLGGALIGGLLVNAKLATTCALAVAAALGLYWMHLAAEAPARGPDPAVADAQGTGAGAARLESAAGAALRSATPAPAEPAPPPAMEDPRTLHGLVVDAQHVPIPGATIEVLRTVGQHDVTNLFRDEQPTHVADLSSDASGRFQIPLTAGLGFDLVLRARGFAPLSWPGATSGSELVIVLGRAASVSGHVRRKSDHAPCAGASLRCSAVRRELPGPLPCEVTTDAQGRFEILDLAPGAISLDVLPVDEAPLDDVQIALVQGEQATREIEVDSGTEVEGVVLDADSGDPIAGARIGDPWSTRFHSTTSDAQGRFLLRGVVGGNPYTRVGVRAPGFAFEQIQVWTTVARAKPVEIRLHSGIRARGSLVDAEGRPLAAARVRATGRGSGGGTTGYDTVGTRSDSEGRFEFDGLRRDLFWHLSIDADTAATRLLPFPGPPLRGTCVDFGEIALAEPAMLRGRLVDTQGAGIEGFYVCLQTDKFDTGPFPADYAPDGQAGKHQVRTDSQGRFALGGLRGGTWRLWAGVKGCARSVERAVEVQPGVESEELLLTLDLGESISGTIVAAEGSPVAGCVLTFYPSADDLHRTSYLLTDADGSFRQTGLDAGTYTLVAEPGALSSVNAQAALATARLERVQSGARDLRVVLPPSDTIAGVIDLPDGSHEPACTVLAYRNGAPLEGWPEATAFTDDEGRFRMVVPRGAKFTLRAHRYALKPSANGFDAAEAQNIDSGTKELVLHLVHHD